MHLLPRVLLVLCVAGATAVHAHRDWAVDLSAEEREWIAQHPVVRVAQIADFGPFSFIDERGQVAGIDPDYLKLIATKTGLRFEDVPQPALGDALEALKQQRLDVVMGIGKQPAREAFMRFTVPYEYSPDAIVTRSDAPFLFDPRALNGQRVGVALTSTTVLGTLAAQAPDAQVVTYPSMAEAVRAVSRGEVFAAFTDASLAAFTAKRERLTNLRVGGVFVAGDVHVGVRPDYEPLVRIFDKAFIAMPADVRLRLSNRWMSLDYESDRRWERVSRALFIVLAVGGGLLGLVFFSSRRRARELAVRKRMQEELEAARDALEQANRGKSGLMRMIAHDLRNPLAALAMSVEVLPMTEEGSVSRTEVLADVDAAVRRLKSLIDTLVDVQALEDGKRRYQRDPVDVVQVLRAAAAGLVEEAARKGIRVRVDDDAVPVVESDASALRQVADNLLSNAIKYSPLEADVQVSFSVDDAWVRFSVLDAGPGISTEEREKLFRKYARGSAVPTGGEKSTGLGLWIVQQISVGLGGEVRCDSVPGQGATFTFSLPRRGALSSWSPSAGPPSPSAPPVS